METIFIKKKQVKALKDGLTGGQAYERGEDGMMVVEAVLSFTVFIMVNLAIISLINIFIIHNKIQFAINTAANQISSYSYLASGIRDAEKTVENDFGEYAGNIDNTVNQVMGAMGDVQNTISSAGELAEDVQNLDADSAENVIGRLKQLGKTGSETKESVKAALSSSKELFSNPKQLLAGVLYILVDSGTDLLKGVVATAAAEWLTESVLENDREATDDYLKRYGIEDGYDGLDFSGSTMMCDEDKRIIDIVVSYDVSLKEFLFILPNYNIHMVQRASVAAWVDGDGKKVEKNGNLKN